MPRKQNKIANQASQLSQLTRVVAQKRGSKQKQNRRDVNLGGLVGNLANELVPGSGKTINSLAKILPEIAMMFPTSGTTMQAQMVPNAVGAINGISQVSAPAANGAIIQTPNPRTTTISGGVRCIHRELVTTIAAPGDSEFHLTYLGALNPRNRLVFPWLADMGKMYEFYKFNTLRIIYEPICNVTNTDGAIEIAIDYDPVDLPPTSSQQLMSYAYAIEVPPWTAGVCTAPQTWLNKRLNTAGATPPPNTDPKTYYIGNMYVAVDNSSVEAGKLLGKVFIEYSVDLTIPNQEYQGSEQFGLTGYSRDSDEHSAQVSAWGSLFVTYDKTKDNVFINNPFFIEFPGLYQVFIYWLAPTPNDVPLASTITPLDGTTIYNSFTNPEGLNWPNFGNSYDIQGLQFEVRYLYFTSGPGGFTVDYPQSNIDTNIFMTMIITPMDSALLPFLGIQPMDASQYRLAQNRRIRSVTTTLSTLALKSEPSTSAPVAEVSAS